MAKRNDALEGRLSRYREIKISGTGRKSGCTISIPIWFVSDDENLYLLPVQGSDPLAGPEDRGWGYTESNPGVQNGNPGLYNDETESQSHCDISSYSAAYADLRDNQEVAACKYAEVIFGRPEG